MRSETELLLVEEIIEQMIREFFHTRKWKIAVFKKQESGTYIAILEEDLKYAKLIDAGYIRITLTEREDGGVDIKTSCKMIRTKPGFIGRVKAKLEGKLKFITPIYMKDRGGRSGIVVMAIPKKIETPQVQRLPPLPDDPKLREELKRALQAFGYQYDL